MKKIIEKWCSTSLILKIFIGLVLGAILGLMPHPEAFLTPENHPLWRRQEIKEAAGLALLKNGVDYINSRSIK